MNQQDRNKVQISLVSGSCSGILSTIMLYPMDVIRTKMQTGGCGRGPIEVVRHTVTHGGVKALYTGMALPLAAQAIYKGTVFFVNDMTQNLIRDFREWRYSKQINGTTTTSSTLQGLTLSDRFWCGFIGGAVNGALFVTPVEFVRNQLIAQHSKIATSSVVITTTAQSSTATTSITLFRGSWDVVRHTIQKQSIFSLWRGIGWTIVRDGFGCGSFFCTIALFQQTLTPVGEAPSFAVNVLAGGIAGLSYWVVALPTDSIKTWVQSSEIQLASVSVKETLRNIYIEHGIVGVVKRLLRGWQVAYGKGVPSSALIVVSYSFVYDCLSKIA
jgi:solute carrier family 25 (mitochondrial carnitine/acylcarnitine transporter), member 20/29